MQLWNLEFRYVVLSVSRFTNSKWWYNDISKCANPYSVDDQFVNGDIYNKSKTNATTEMHTINGVLLSLHLKISNKI